MSKVKWGMSLACLLSVGSAFGFSGWDESNKPELMEFNYERVYNNLPKYSVLEKMPWSGDYWPTYKGGITYRWNKKNTINDIILYG